MSRSRYTTEFKAEAIKQVIDRGYSVVDVSVAVKALGALRELDERVGTEEPPDLRVIATYRSCAPDRRLFR